MRDFFHRIAHRISDAVGSPWAFALAVLTIIGWVAAGPLFGYSNTWQLVINTGTTIVTFLAVFLIQHTQNRDAKVVHLKLDVLLRSSGKAGMAMVDMEDFSEEEIDLLEKEFRQVRERIVAGRKKPDHRNSHP